MAAHYGNTSLDVYIIGKGLSVKEQRVLDAIQAISLVDELPKKDTQRLIVLTSSTLISANFFAPIDDSVSDQIILPRYLVKIGEDFTLEDISHQEYPSRNFYTLHTDKPIWAALQFSGNSAMSVLHSLRSQTKIEVELVMSTAQETMAANLAQVTYIDQAISFFRVDKYTDSLKSSDFFTASRLEMRNLLQAISRNNLVYTQKTLDIVPYDIPEQLLGVGITSEAITYWHKLNEVDPQVRPSHILLDDILLEPVSRIDEIMHLYASIEEKIPNVQFEHLVLLPHLRKGGADKAASYLIGYLSARNQTIIITTEPTSSSTELSVYENMTNVHVLDASEEFGKFSQDVGIEALRLLVGTIAPSTVDVINSQLAYSLMSSRFTRINENIQWYVHAYAHVYEEGYKIPPFHNGLCDAYLVVEQYFTDSQSFKNELMKIYGVPDNLISVTHIPLGKEIAAKTNYERNNRIVWIGRICEEKLFREIVLPVANLLSHDGVTVDVWGPVDEKYITLDEITKNKDIIYRGTFTSIDEVDFNEYDMLLFSTINEGVPNVIIEAAVGGLFVVSPAVGGISEIVRWGESALLVSDERDKDVYYNAIIKAYKTNLYQEITKLVQHASNLKAIHSRESYDKAMDEARKVRYDKRDR